MKKIIIKAITFLAILFVLLLIISRIVVPKNNTKAAGVSKGKIRQVGILAEPENTLDVIMAGNSEAYTSFIPLEAWNEYGYASYVLGSPGQKLPAIVTVLYDAIKKQNPKVVMLEADTIYKETKITSPILQLVNRVLPVLQYHNRWKKLNGNDFFGEINYTKRQRDKGFYLSYKVVSGKNKKYMKKSDEIEKIQKANELYVKLIKHACDAKGIEFMLYSTPSMVNWTTAKHNGIEKLAKELGVEYLDMNLMKEEVNIDWKVDTRDEGDHLNYTGSLKATKFLAKYLKENKDLPDHRQDKKYKSWNKDYKKYMKEINEENKKNKPEEEKAKTKEDTKK